MPLSTVYFVGKSGENNLKKSPPVLLCEWNIVVLEESKHF
jgi:hypothetical protein